MSSKVLHQVSCKYWYLLYLRLQLRFILVPIAWYVAQYTIKKSQTYGAWIWSSQASHQWFMRSHSHLRSYPPARLFQFQPDHFLGHQNCSWSLITEHVAAIGPPVMPPIVVLWNDSCESCKSICSFVRNDLRKPDILGAMSPPPTLLCNAFNLIASNLVAVSGMSQFVAPGIMPFASNYAICQQWPQVVCRP